MSRSTDALSADREALIGMCDTLDSEGWARPSGCQGWSVKDVVSHMGALYWAVVDPSTLPDTAGVGTEEAQEMLVVSRRSMSAEQVLEDYATVSEKAIGILDTFDGVDVDIPLGDLGTYPVSVLPTAFCFDHFTHIRADLFAPRGPFDLPAPPADELRVMPTLEWIDVALRQQNRAVLDGFGGAADIVVTGAGGKTIRVGNPGAEATAVVVSDAETCVRWITKRARWDEIGVETSGDRETLTVLQSLKVF